MPNENVVMNLNQQPFEGVAAGQKATARIPVGMVIHNIKFNYSGVTLAQMTSIRVLVNGKTQMAFRGADMLDKMNVFDRKLAAAGILTIDFERAGLITRAGREHTVLDTGKREAGHPRAINTVTVEVDIAAGATAPVLGVPYCRMTKPAYKDGKHVAGSDVVKHIGNFSYNVGGAGVFQISDLPRHGAINRIFIKSSETINNIRLELDRSAITDMSKEANERNQKDGVRTPQADYYVLDFSDQGYGGDYIEIESVQDFRLFLDMAGATTIEVVVEYLDHIIR